ncbi:MAG: Glu/Leu/Phe/Val dehydrogenase dimerization domain-containing protein [Pseudomonadota bacterium]
MFISSVEQSELQLPHEQVVVRHDAASGLSAVIALHNTQLGPAAGGCRRWSYVSTDAAVEDALRLSEGMTFKNALAGIPFGGGKSVIIARPGEDAPTSEQLAVFGQWLNELAGRYITAEDVGMGVAQMQELARHTKFAAGTGHRGVGGDPSPKTAYGVFVGIKSAIEYGLNRASVNGLHISVQGLGAVGMALCALLHQAGARLTVADIEPCRVALAKQRFGATGVDVKDINKVAADVFAPCALGGVINEAVAHEIDVSVIAGAANNQLLHNHCGDILAGRGITYAPDFVINAAGVISVGQECLMRNNYFQQADTLSLQRWAESRIQGIAYRLTRIFDMASAKGCSTDTAAKRLALSVLAQGDAQRGETVAA